jgi:NADH dehydrogenase
MQLDKKLKKIKRVVILGAGFGGVNLYRSLHKLVHGDKDWEFVIISDNNYFLFTPLIHEVATGSLFPEDLVFPIRENFSCCVREVIVDKVISIDAYKKNVILKNEKISFDYLVISTGASVNYWGIEGALENSIPLYDIKDAIKLKNNLISVFEKANEVKQKSIKIVIVGGGATGIELATEIVEFVERMKPFYENLKILDTKIKVEILNSSTKFIPNFPDKVRKKILSILSREDNDLSILLDSKVMKVDSSSVYLLDKRKLDYDLLVWAAGVKPNTPKINIDSVKTDERIKVDKYFNIKPFKNIFAIGDVADFKDINGNSLPQFAQIAEEEGKICAENIYRISKKLSPISFEYKGKGLLLSLGRNNAIVSLKNVIFTGKTAWILWKFIYLGLMFGKGTRLRVFSQWIINSLSPRNISKI